MAKLDANMVIKGSAAAAAMPIRVLSVGSVIKGEAASGQARPVPIPDDLKTSQ
jgi:hypothetical protein